MNIIKGSKFFQEYHYKEELWYINTAPKSPVLNIELTGITYADPSYRIRRKPLWDMYILEYITDGKGYIHCDGQKYTVKKGDAYIIRNFTNHEYYADPQAPYQKVWVNLSGALVDHLLTVFNLTESVIVRSVDLSECFNRLKKQLETEYNLEELAPIVLNMIFKMSESFKPLQKQNLSLAEKIKLYIDKNLYKAISTADVATHFHITPIYASRIFKAHYHQTIHQYISESSLKLAAQWLKTSDYTIGEISDMLGYCNDNYFANQFRKYFGCSPKQYQLQYRQKMICNTPVEQAPTEQTKNNEIGSPK
ncbi:MAG: helix-turn-helix domain-containing protein [Clostridia bacterium]|nr:helix-turn-helix domain-containing protein [Clostridia bacterium]